MSLRKSPTRTPALLAANRANAHKSTGPRTLEGKRRVGLNALRHGLHAPNALTALAKSSHALREFNGLYLALYAALLPDTTDERAMDLLKRTVLHVWAMKQELTRWAASRAEREAWFGETGGVFPRPEQLLANCQCLPNAFRPMSAGQVAVMRGTASRPETACLLGRESVAIRPPSEQHKPPEPAKAFGRH
jgi:hypothetical protein